MENILPNYSRPLASTKEPSITVKYWDEAKEFFDNNEYKKALIAVINYLNTDVLKDVNLDENIHVAQMHGSAEINIEIDETTFKVYVPFLKITEETNVVALLRKVAEVNFSRFDLVQIILKEDKLTIAYEAPLELCQPYKIYTLLREVCFRSDEFDDEFIENYGADFYKEVKRTELTEEEQEKAWLQIDNIFQEYEEYSNYFKEKQRDGYQWDIGIISLLKIANMPYVNGVLRHEIIEHVELMYNGDKEFNYRVEKGRNYIKKLSKKSKNELLSNLYHTEQFISMLWRSSPEIISEKLEDYKKNIEKYNKEENAFAASYYLQSIFLKLIYNYNLSKTYKNAIENVLEETSSLKPEDAAPKLLAVYYSMYNKELEDDDEESSVTQPEEEEKGTWSKISDYLMYFGIAYLVVKYLILGAF